jgi:single-strand DNA-binding protein
MASLNRCEFIGNVGKDPESRYLQNGDAVTNLSIACNESWTDKTSGEKVEKVEWVNLVFFKKIAEIAGKYLKKGSQCFVSGRLQTRKWQDKEGVTRYSTEVVVDKLVLLGGKRDEDGGEVESDAPPAKTTKTVKGKTVDDLDEDIPF